jgi:hypothetical protein
VPNSIRIVRVEFLFYQLLLPMGHGQQYQQGFAAAAGAGVVGVGAGVAIVRNSETNKFRTVIMVVNFLLIGPVSLAFTL